MKGSSEQPAEPLSSQTTLLSVDIEANGLHGEGFAVGAVVMKLDGTVTHEYVARCPIKGELDPWVAKNVLPAIKDLPETHKTAKALRGDFWRWFTAAKVRSDYVLFGNGYPVEARFFIACQEDDLEERYWDHAYPILELGSLLIQVGIKPLAVNYRLVADQIEGEILHHHPRFDAYVAALAAAHAFKLSGRWQV